MAERSATQVILDWIYSTGFENIPPALRQSATLAIYDTVGAMLACSLLPVAHRMADFVKLLGGAPDCSMIGFPSRTSVMNAALVNGTLGHADELDALESDLLGQHVMSTCVGAALAAGQFAGASGREVIRAVILGRELTKRVNAVAAKVKRNGGVVHGQIDASNTMGAVVAAGIAMGLPQDRMDVALSLAAMMVCGLPPSSRENQHMAKSFVRGGVGAKNAIAAVLMAKVGYDAPRDIFDGRHGFFHGRLGLEQPGSEFLTGRDQEFALGQLIFKRYAAGGPNLAPKQALLEIMLENGLVAADIQEILAEVPLGNIKRILNNPYPAFHGKGMLALAALHGGVGFREIYQEKIYRSPEANALRERVKFEGRPDWNNDESRFRAALTVTTKDGRKLRKEIDYRQMTSDELDVKFSELVGLRAGAAKAKELAGILKQLDTANNIADLMVRLEIPAATIDQV